MTWCQKSPRPTTLVLGVPFSERLWGPCLAFHGGFSCSLESGCKRGHAEVLGVDVKGGWVLLHTLGPPPPPGAPVPSLGGLTQASPAVRGGGH